VFAQRKNLLSLTFWAMLKDMLRFNKLCTTLAKNGQDSALQESVGEFLAKHQFGKPFIDNYFLPMIACIWSCPAEQMMAFPMATMVRFCHNHGLLQLIGRPQWFTITGGSRHYVKAIEKSLLESKRCELRVNASVNAVHRSADSVSIISAAGTETFDGVLFACHSDQALAVLEQGTGATEQERQILGAIRYQNNRAVLHTDTTLMPKNKIAWAAWNYEKSPPNDAQQTVCLHYWLNKLQPLPTQVPVMVTLNPIREPAVSTVIQSYDYAHPVFDAPAIAAQAQVASIQGERTWFAGAWCKFGFHEDGFTSGTQAAALACASLAQLHKKE
jgi:predicted NAD/FAD-binding protein